MSFDYDQYLRLDKFPMIFCPGCGDGIILKATFARSTISGWTRTR